MSAAMGTYMAKKQAKGMLAPLLEEDEDESSSTDSDDTDSSSSSSEMETVKQGPLEKLKSVVVYVVLGLGLVASAGAMALSPAIPIFIMGGLTIANIPYAAIKERSMGKLPSLRAMNSKLREDANQLEDQVDQLSEEIDLLEPEADKAAAIEEELRDIASSQQVNVNHLVELVKENEVILKEMRENLRNRVVQDITGIVIKSDKDNDHAINKLEAKMLSLQIRLHLQEYGVTLDSDKFLLAIGKDPTVPGVITMVQRLMPAAGDDEDSGSDSDSESDDDSVMDMFYLGGEDSGGGSQNGGLGMSLMHCDDKKKHTSSAQHGFQNKSLMHCDKKKHKRWSYFKSFEEEADSKHSEEEEDSKW